MSDRRASRFPSRIFFDGALRNLTVIRDTARLVLGRYITAYDGLDIIPEAAQAAVPGP